jgi:hypothetical protein
MGRVVELGGASMVRSHMQSDFKSFRDSSGMWNFFFIYGAFATVLTFALVRLSVSQGQLDMPFFIAGWCLLSWYVIVGLVFLIDTSELLVDEEQIARRMFGVICQRTRWKKITLIRETYVKTPKGTVVVLHILPDRYPFWRFRLRGVLRISDKSEPFQELIDILNQRIVTHQIPVEIIKEGLRERRPRLLPPPGYTVDDDA